MSYVREEILGNIGSEVGEGRNTSLRFPRGSVGNVTLDDGRSQMALVLGDEVHRRTRRFKEPLLLIAYLRQAKPSDPRLSEYAYCRLNTSPNPTDWIVLHSTVRTIDCDDSEFRSVGGIGGVPMTVTGSALYTAITRVAEFLGAAASQ